ncbi:MAG: aldehyde dehydrogenase family protein [Deltaproteobacteria bacterium]|nr:MAG: aldehyde dehydrogenase family protein [Deltaproteobacteria bacterium]
MPIAVESAPAPRTDPAAIPECVRRVRHGFESGKTRPIAWRLGQLERLRALLVENGDALVETLREDLGKPVLEAWAADIVGVAAEIKGFRKKLRRWMRPERVATPLEQRPARARIVREPLGVVLIIAPWNYPLQLLFTPMVAAIGAGNGAVLKPSEVTAHTSALLAKLVPEYLDPDCIALVEGGVAETTALLAERFDHIFYTGNGSVGRIVMEAAARHLTPVTLELGGKSPCIVDRDVDVAVAARRIAWGKFLNAGQTCIAPDYVLVHREREAELVETLKQTLDAWYGEAPRENPDFGRIVNDRHHQRLAALLKDGEVVVGGECDASDRYVAPTLLRNVRFDSALMREEIFGPILPILTVRDVDEAIDVVNRGPKPLALYVFSRDPGVEDAVVSRTSSGGVCVNATLWHLANPNLPFGGVGASGMGAYHGRHGFETFSHRKPVVRRSTRFDPRFAYPPYSRFKVWLLKRML